MFEDVTVLLLWVVATYIVATVIEGFIGVFYYATNSVKRIELELIQHLDHIIHRVRVEQDRKIYYWYDEDDGEFLAQGSTDAELVDQLKRRFPTHIFYLPTQHIISEKTNWKPADLPIKIDL
jgi:hypothetical protein